MALVTGAKLSAVKILLLAALPGLSACVPLVLGTVAVTAVDVAHDRRTVGVYLNDNVLEFQLRGAIRADQSLDGTNVSVTAHNGIVLLTGQVTTDEQRQQVDALAQSYKKTGKVASVVNELELGSPTSALSRTNDTTITGKVKAALLKVEGVPFPAIKVVTENSRVYLLGLVTEAEADAVVEVVSKVGGITQIVKVFGKRVE